MHPKNEYRIINVSHRAVAAIGLVFWFLFVGVFFLTDFNLLKIVLGFPLLVIYPGLLIMLSLHLKNRFDWSYFGLVVGFSLLYLLMFGLFLNMALPLLHIIPLRPVPLFIAHSIAFVLLSVFPIVRKNHLHITWYHFDLVHVGLPFVASLFVAASVLGALRLNNGFSGDVILTSLGLMALFMVAILMLGNKIREGVMGVVIYFISLALLLMTSLRGWGIVGHDIQREYSVFQLTHQAGVWSSVNLRDAYDACMSISILPTILAEMLTIPDVYVFKLLFQLIFAVVPVLAYVLFSKYFSRTVALLSVFILISFPTFFTDMPMLNRQEIAFLFFSLLVLIMFDKTIKQSQRSFLVLFFGLGIILSHYSTTYIVLLFLLMGWFGFWFLKLLFSIRTFSRLLTRSKLVRKNFVLGEKPVAPLFVLLILIGSSFIWSNTFTNTSDSSIRRVLVRTFEAVMSDSESSKSTDTLYSLFTTKKQTPEETLIEYKTEVIDVARREAKEGVYLSGSDVDNYLPVLKPEEALPKTSFGLWVESFVGDVGELNKTLKFGSAKFLQLFLLLGLLVSLFKAGFFKTKPNIEFLLLSVAGVFFLSAMVLIPVLSVEYGVLRAFQQILLIAAPFVTIGGLVFFALFGKKLAQVLTTTFVIVFFLASTGVTTQILGGYKPLLHLNNAGPYYDYFYVHDSEVSGLKWITEEANKNAASYLQSDMQADNYFSKQVNGETDISASDEIYPSLTRTNSYVLLGYSKVTNGTAVINYNGVILNFEYPTFLIDTHKNKVYNSDGVIIYR